jgi:hypothetical protein
MKLALASIVGLAAFAVSGCAEPYYAEAPAVIGVPVAAVAPAAIPGGCFRSHDIRNHTVADNHTLYLDVPPRGVYRVTTNGACLAGAVSSDPLVMRSPPGQTYVCRPMDLDIAVSKGGFTSPCIVDSITQLTPEEVAALPRKLRP